MDNVNGQPSLFPDNYALTDSTLEQETRLYLPSCAVSVVGTQKDKGTIRRVSIGRVLPVAESCEVELLFLERPPLRTWSSDLPPP